MSGISIASNMVQSMFTGTSVAMRKDGVFYAKEQETSVVYTQIAIKSISDVSAMAQVALKRIASSTLNNDQKEALIRLAAFVNENGGEPSFYRDLMALVNLMEMGANETGASDVMSEEEALEIFRENQKEIFENNADSVSIDVAFAQFESKFLGGLLPQQQSGSVENLMKALATMQGISLYA